MIGTYDAFEAFDTFVQHIDGVLQAAAGSDVITLELEHGRAATWTRGRFRIRIGPTRTGVAVMVELDGAYRDDFREWRTSEGAVVLGDRLAELLRAREHGCIVRGSLAARP